MLYFSFYTSCISCAISNFLCFEQEEENVLAQEVMLDVLVKTENTHKQWALWEGEEQFSAVGHA